MRTSADFPKWLNAPETKAQLQGKTVMMYCEYIMTLLSSCILLLIGLIHFSDHISFIFFKLYYGIGTGGIRCERATALLNQITDVEPEFKTKDVVMVRGGIERYLKTFPQGGYWKGKNYLFDKRMDQAPSKKTSEELEKDVESSCCLCQEPCSYYRGQHKCAVIIPASTLACSVPVLVCDKCQEDATDAPERLTCPLCAQGYQTPNTAPDLVGQKRKLGLIARGGLDAVTGQKIDNATASKSNCISQRVFVGKLPLTITASKLRQSFEVSNCEVTSIHWITGEFVTLLMSRPWYCTFLRHTSPLLAFINQHQTTPLMHFMDQHFVS